MHQLIVAACLAVWLSLVPAAGALAGVPAPYSPLVIQPTGVPASA